VSKLPRTVKQPQNQVLKESAYDPKDYPDVPIVKADLDKSPSQQMRDLNKQTPI